MWKKGMRRRIFSGNVKWIVMLLVLVENNSADIIKNKLVYLTMREKVFL